MNKYELTYGIIREYSKGTERKAFGDDCCVGCCSTNRTGGTDASCRNNTKAIDGWWRGFGRVGFAEGDHCSAVQKEKE